MLIFVLQIRKMLFTLFIIIVNVTVAFVIRIFFVGMLECEALIVVGLVNHNVEYGSYTWL